LPGTFQAALVVALAVLPGALYVWAFERIVGPWGIGLVDRLLRFIGISAIFHAAFLPITYDWYGRYVVSGELAAGAVLPRTVYLGVIAYVALPIAAGALVGLGIRRRWRWATFVAGSQRAPRAFDELFLQGGTGYVRLKLKDVRGGDRWLAGWFGRAVINGQERRSRVSRYPEAQDLYLVQTLACDEGNGELLLRNGQVIPFNESLLIRWEEVAYLYFEAAGRRAGSGATEGQAPSHEE
jgi:hypothetical protein